MVEAGIATRPAEEGTPAGRPPDADALVVDSYDVPSREIEAAAGELPVAAVIDGGAAPAGVTVLSYHLDAAERLPSVSGLLGPDFAPLDPRHAAARRPRGHRRVLVTVGGSNAGLSALASALEELGRRDREHELFVAARELPSGAPGEDRVGVGARRPRGAHRVGRPRRERRGGHPLRACLRWGACALGGRCRQPTPGGGSLRAGPGSRCGWTLGTDSSRPWSTAAGPRC